MMGKYLEALQWLIALVVVLVTVALFVCGCGPIHKAPDPSFYVVFVNDSNTTQKVTITEWHNNFSDSTASGVASVASHSEWSYRLSATAEPDMIDVKAGWGHASWSGPEIKRAREGHEGPLRQRLR